MLEKGYYQYLIDRSEFINISDAYEIFMSLIQVNDLLLEDGEDVNLHSDAPPSKLRLDEEPEKPQVAAVFSSSTLDSGHASLVAPRAEEHKNYVLKISVRFILLWFSNTCKF